MYLGVSREGDNVGRVVPYNGEAHIITIGPTRSGKSRRMLIPVLLTETGRSMLVVDIKGELAKETAAPRRNKGGRIIALDPFDLLKRRGVDVETVSFNPMDRLNPKEESFVDDAMVLAEALIQVQPDAKEPHWTESAQDFVCALIMWAKFWHKDKAHLNHVRELICKQPDKIAALAYAARTEEDCPPQIAAKLAKFDRKPGGDTKELDSILSTAQTQTRFLDSPGIVRSLQRPSADVVVGSPRQSPPLDFHDLKTERMTIYLVLPPDKLVTHAKWLRLIISSAMMAMQRSDKNPDRPPVLFMLDEFPQLGRLAPIETAVSLNAGYGVQVWMAIQNLGQLKDLYNDNWETFLSAGCWVAFSPRDWFTRDHLTKLLGTGSKAKVTISTDPDGRTSRSTGVEKDDWIASHEWQALKMGQTIALIPTDNGQIKCKLFVEDFSKMGLV